MKVFEWSSQIKSFHIKSVEKSGIYLLAVNSEIQKYKLAF